MRRLLFMVSLWSVGGLVGPGVAGAVPMRRHFVVDAAARGAVCNNGSDAAYYYRPGVSDDTWVVFLGGTGNGGCPSIADCDQRWIDDPQTMATTWIGIGGLERTISSTRVEGGILSDDPAQNPYLYDANHVFVYPCSNDAWRGTAPGSASTGGWSFLGDPTVRAVIEDLQSEHALSLADADELIFAGSNAGADGVRHHIEDVQAQLGTVMVLGLLDGRMHTDYRPQGWRPLAPGGEVESVREMYALHGFVPPQECFDEHGPDADECFLFHSLYPYVDAPLFVVISQRDSTNLGNLWGVPFPRAPNNPEALAYRDALIDAVQALPRGTGYFVPDADWHKHTILKGRFTNHPISDPITGDDLNVADAFESWRAGDYIPRLIE